MTVKKAIELIKQNNFSHQEDIKLYDEILQKYAELDRIKPPTGELTKQMHEIFLGLVTMIKVTKETQIKFNQGIINLLSRKVEMISEDKTSFRRKRIKKLFEEGYKQKDIAQKMDCSLSTVEKDLRTMRKG